MLSSYDSNSTAAMNSGLDTCMLPRNEKVVLSGSESAHALAAELLARNQKRAALQAGLDLSPESARKRMYLGPSAGCLGGNNPFGGLSALAASRAMAGGSLALRQLEELAHARASLHQALAFPSSHTSALLSLLALQQQQQRQSSSVASSSPQLSPRLPSQAAPVTQMVKPVPLKATAPVELPQVTCMPVSSSPPPLAVASRDNMTRSTSAGSMASSHKSGSMEGTSLAIAEDPNWLSDFHVFVRKHLVELCWSVTDETRRRGSSEQVGIKCKFCSHMNPSARVQRSCAFPSSIAQIYQSFTMMLRDHFGQCSAIPEDLKTKFLVLKDKTTQGATDSKLYWIYSAKKLGMVDSNNGILMNEQTRAIAAASIPPFGSSTDSLVREHDAPLPLVLPKDRAVASDFLYTLMLNSRRVRLQKSEQRGNKKSLELGLPGFGCRHCGALGRMGNCRMFPARRRTLGTKMSDLYDHLKRCTACPKETKELLEVLRAREENPTGSSSQKDFLDVVWSRLLGKE